MDILNNIIKTFEDVMDSDDTEEQIKLILQLPKAAKMIGEEKVREVLLPEVKNSIFSMKDNSLMELLSSFDEWLPLIGGKKYAHELVEILCKVCDNEEVMLRDKAIQVIKTIVKNLDKTYFSESFSPLIKEMAEKQYWSSKCSASSLLQICYVKVDSEEKEALNNIYRNLLQDESPLVRKAAAVNLIEFIPILNKANLIAEYVPVFDNISSDNTDSINILAVDLAVELAKRFSLLEVEEFLVPKLEQWKDDKSWKTRLKLAQRIDDLQRTIPYEKTKPKLIEIYQKLTEDPETEVRLVIAKNTFNYTKALKETSTLESFQTTFTTVILPKIRSILQDTYEEVRLCFSETILKFGSILDQDCFINNILPLALNSLQTEASSKCQQSILEKLNTLPKGINFMDSFSNIGATIDSIIKKSFLNWRARRSILMVLAFLVKQTTKDYFKTNLLAIYLNMLTDPTYAVRRTSSVLLPILAKQFGIEWISENLMPYFLGYVEENRYYYQFITLNAIQELTAPSLKQNCENEAGTYLLNLIEVEETREKGKLELVTWKYLIQKVNLKIAECNLDLTSEKIPGNSSEDLRFYAEDIFDSLQENNSENFFSINLTQLQEGSFCYIKGLLFLIHQEFIKVIEKLLKSPVQNMQMKAKQVFNIIKTFLENLERSLSEQKLKEHFESIKGEEISQIEDLIGKQLNDNVLKIMKDKYVKIEGEEKGENLDNPEPLPDLRNDVLFLEYAEENLDLEEDYSTEKDDWTENSTEENMNDKREETEQTFKKEDSN